MCIICISPPGVRQPTVSTLRTMFFRNPHGAGYMTARDGKVIIHKGFMDINSFLRAVHDEHFTAQDSVVYHFRISTQAGITPEMTHPFPLSNQPAHMRALDVKCAVGVAHNGIIRLTSDPTNTRSSDTAVFITDYLSHMIRTPDDLRNQALLTRVYDMAQSRFAIMDADGYVATVGQFITDNGLVYSNDSYLPFVF